MIWKFLLTVAVLVAAAFFIRERLRGPGRPRDGAPPPPLLPAGMARTLAYTTIFIMFLGSSWYLYRDWAHGHQVVEVQVVNANTGVITPYKAHRRDVQGRVVRTLDGREIRLADVERMILTPEGQGF